MPIYKWSYQTPANYDDILMNSDGEYLTGLWFENSKDTFKHHPDAAEKSLTIFDQTTKWLDLYFTGQSPDFTPPYRLGQVSPFTKKVLTILKSVPFGQSISYQDIAVKIAKDQGIKKMSPQAVGGAVGANPICLIIPCHRVIGKDGKIVGYSSGLQNKIELLKHEGIIFN